MAKDLFQTQGMLGRAVEARVADVVGELESEDTRLLEQKLGLLLGELGALRTVACQLAEVETSIVVHRQLLEEGAGSAVSDSVARLETRQYQLTQHLFDLAANLAD